jgi:hypothetical protein
MFEEGGLATVLSLVTKERLCCCFPHFMGTL